MPLEEWLATVHDPAEQATEGRREIRLEGVHAGYEIAPVPNGWAIKMDARYDGDMTTTIPWRNFRTRGECVEHFVTNARRFFEVCQTTQKHHIQARKEMVALLTETGLFGFQEPEVKGA